MRSEEPTVQSSTGQVQTSDPIPLRASSTQAFASFREITLSAGPRPSLHTIDVIALVVGMVVGAGIFRTPSLIAANAGSESAIFIVWIAGALISLAGVMCYAELASAYPNAGGEFHFLKRAYGRKLAFLFAWARLTIIPTGSVAVMAFLFGDYLSELFRLGTYSASLYAALIVLLLTGVNLLGIQHGKRTQNILTIAEIGGVLLIIVAGLLWAPGANSQNTSLVTNASQTPSHAAWGLMMVFVLLTYGGWNDVAYISAEIKGSRKNVARALLWSIAVIATLYLLVNLSYLNALGLKGTAESETVASDLMKQTAGIRGAQLISLLIAISAVTSANATMLLGARGHYAFGRDFAMFSSLGKWDRSSGAPVNALLVQSAIILALVLMGTLTRKGFQTMVEFTAPVFWFFFFLTGLSLFILRKKEPDAFRPFRVPFYPFTPVLFCAVSAYLLYSSLVYTGIGAFVGTAVLAVGAILLWKGNAVQKLKLRSNQQCL